MPFFSLTPQQLAAVEVFKWLYDDSDQVRRTGRTMVLALSIVQRAARARHLHAEDRWIPLADHVDIRRAESELWHQIQTIASALEIPIDIDSNRRRCRMDPSYRISGNQLQQLSEFEVKDTVGGESAMLQYLKSPKPTKTVWERLEEDDL